MKEPSMPIISKLFNFLRRIAWEALTVIVPALLIAFLIDFQVAKAVEIEDGPSMKPNLYKGYRVMTEKVSYRFHIPERGDIVVSVQPNGEKISLIKRAMGLPGETIEVHGGHVFVNGQAMEEPWVTYFGGPEYGPAKIPDGYLFIIGDNRSDSRDSRSIGPVPLSTILGHVWLVYWPLEEFRLIP
jgi:signal peptidase I